MSKDKIVLIDGHSILHRAFYGIPDLTNSEGIHTNAVYGFLNILFKILDEEQAQYLAVAFDLHAPTFRHEMYKEYKGTRKPMPEELRQQVPLTKQMLQAMGIPLLMLEGYEADDLIGTISLRCEKEGLDVSIISGDRDLLQLASDTTLVRIPKTKRSGTEIEDYYAKDVLERYQVTPHGIIELKALMGDASDNIPGIPGVGEKTATKIIAQYETIENAYAHADEIKPNRARDSLKEHYDLAQLSKTLATINRESPVEFTLEDARIGDLYTPQALELCKKLEFRQFLSRFEGKETSDSGKKEWELLVLDNPFEAEDVLSEFEKQESFGFHVLSEENALIGIALCWEPERAYFVTEEVVPDIAARLHSRVKSVTGTKRIAAIDLKEQLVFLGDASGAGELSGDGEQTGNEDLPEESFFDCAVASYLLNPLKNAYPYDDILREAEGVLVPGREELIGKLPLRNAMLVQPEKTAAYACYHAITAFRCMNILDERLRGTGMDKLFYEVEMPLVFTLHHMQQEGILVKGEELRSYGQNLEGRISELEQQIWNAAGEEFNINSPKQLGVILFEKLKMPYAKKTKTGYSTSADVLDKLAEEYPFVADILEYRQLTKLKSTYAEGLYHFIGPDGRIHGKFNQMVTATGRISSTDPNLQNIPVRTELGRELRKVFVPREGYVFIDADYSQIELRVLAAVSGDERLIEAYREAKDIHAITASQVFHIPLDRVTAADRRNAKAVNFGIVYGISSFGLSNGLSISRKEAGEYIEKYFETYPGIKRFLDASVLSAKEKGYAVTLFGRRRPVPELKSNNFMQRSFGERVAMNSPIQGTAADIIKIAMVRVDRALRSQGLSSRLILQVHDELLVEVKQGEQERVREILSREMLGAADLAVALEIDMKEGGDWYEAH